MNVELTKVSQKGQVVIPQNIRERLGIKTGTRLAVFGENDTVILKKLQMPSPEEFERLTRISSEKAKRLGVTDKDIEDAIREVRSENAKGGSGH